MNQRRHFTICALTIVLILAAVADSDEPVEIGSRRELFVDRHLIDQLDGASLTLHRPQPREVVMRVDKPWESYSPGYTTIVRDD